MVQVHVEVQVQLVQLRLVQLLARLPLGPFPLLDPQTLTDPTIDNAHQMAGLPAR